MDTKFEILLENSLYHYRLVINGDVVFRGSDVADVTAAITAATIARATVLAAVTAPTPGDITSAIRSHALAKVSASPIVNLSAGVSDDKGGPG
jgi:hypothetical protein